MDHRQKNQPEQLILAEFTVNNKVHLVTKVSLFIVNYGRELRIRADIRRKGKVEKVTEFAKRMKKVKEEAKTALRKAQEEMKQQAKKRRMETKEQKKENRVLLSTKNLVFKERLVKKLVDQYIGPYFIDKVFSINMVKL